MPEVVLAIGVQPAYPVFQTAFQKAKNQKTTGDTAMELIRFKTALWSHGACLRALCRTLIGVFAITLLAGVAGCGPIRLISDYDETTDQMVSDLQRKTQAHFVALERLGKAPGCEYEHHTAFYDEMKVGIDALVVRATAMEKNETTQKQAELLSGHLNNLEGAHKDGCLALEEVWLNRDFFTSSYTAILKFEIAKKRGQSGQ